MKQSPFRAIRQKLFHEGKLLRYLTYAVGEILLIIIGIMIALQLNNWNEDRKSRGIEIEIYQELLEDLKASHEDIKPGLERHERCLQDTYDVRDHILKKAPFQQDIVRKFVNADADDQFYPRTTGYDYLNSIGLHTLSNDDLRKAITSLFQLSFTRLVNLGPQASDQYSLNFFREVEDKHIVMSDVPRNYKNNDPSDTVLNYRWKFRDYDDFLNDEDVLKELQNVIGLRRIRVSRHQSTADEIVDLVKKIEAELEHLGAKITGERLSVQLEGNDS